MATIQQKEADGSYTLKYVPDEPGPGVPGTPLPPNPVKPDAPPVPAPIARTVDAPVSEDPAERFLSTFTPPETAAQIAERKRKDAQSLIDTTNTFYDTKIRDEQAAGQNRLNKNNSINVLAGLMGSTEAVRTDNEVSAANKKALDAVNAERAVKLAEIYTKISSDADDEAVKQKEDAIASAESVVARRKQAQTDAVTNLTTMAKGGLVDFDAFKSSPANAKVYEYALASVGGSDDALKALFITNRPQDQIVGTPTRVGNSYVQAYKNPITGKVSFETLDVPVDLPVEYNNFQKVGDNIVAIPDGWDGDTTKLVTIAGQPSTMERLQQQSLMLDIQKKQQEVATAVPDADKAKDTLGLVTNSLKTAKDLASASGRSGARRTAEAWFVGSTDYSDLVAATNTLKTNILTLTTDPAIKKFFGPQMSNADVTLMTSAGTSLNPELQKPETMLAELERLEKIVTRLNGGKVSDANLVTAPDGTQVEIVD